MILQMNGQNLVQKNKVIFNEDLKKISKKFDYLVVGSDQVWNYKVIGNFKTYFMLDINRNKNISYAASISVDNIPKELHTKYKKGLNNIKNIL